MAIQKEQQQQKNTQASDKRANNNGTNWNISSFAQYDISDYDVLILNLKINRKKKHLIERSTGIPRLICVTRKYVRSLLFFYFTFLHFSIVYSNVSNDKRCDDEVAFSHDQHKYAMINKRVSYSATQSRDMFVFSFHFASL